MANRKCEEDFQKGVEDGKAGDYNPTTSVLSNIIGSPAQENARKAYNEGFGVGKKVRDRNK